MIERLCLCPNCFNALEATAASKTCQLCGHTLIECKPGDPDDPCRRPLMDSEGDLVTHAPRWWIEHYKRLGAQSSEGNE